MAAKEKITLPTAMDKAATDNLLTNNSIPKNDEKCNSFFQLVNDKLSTISLTELYDTVYQPKAQLIDGLLYSGIYLFVGAPKVGKSFFMAQLGYHISNGHSLWGNSTHKGTVLYLALEDDYARLQKRLSKMFGTDSTDNFHFATQSKNLSEGLDVQLEKFVTEHPDTKLIIIDTLQKIREIGGDGYSYANDYEIIARLKAFADSRHLCIMLVHHTRKQTADDSFDTISGTNDLLGAADGAFIMHKNKRTENEAVLDVVGRDQQDQRLRLLFDRERCIWKLIQAETELWKEPPDSLLEKVVALVNEQCPKWNGSASDLIDSLEIEIQPNVLTRRLNVSADRLWNEYSVRIDVSRNHAGRTISLQLIVNGA